MKRKTIGRNPLDELGPLRAKKAKKGGAKRILRADPPALRAEIRRALQAKPRKAKGVAGWFQSVIKTIAG